MPEAADQVTVEIEIRRLRRTARVVEAVKAQDAKHHSARERLTRALSNRTTFVETPRFTGALYKASGWTHVGTTQGRGRYDRYTRRDQPKKDIWTRPLRKDWRRTLNR